MFCEKVGTPVACDARRNCYTFAKPPAYAIAYPKDMVHLCGKGRDNSLLSPAAQAAVETHAKASNASIVKTAQGAVLDGALKSAQTLEDVVDVRCTPFLSLGLTLL
jgi:hypothetical protein